MVANGLQCRGPKRCICSNTKIHIPTSPTYPPLSIPLHHYDMQRRAVVSPIAAAMGLLNGLVFVFVDKKLSKLHLRKCTRVARRREPKDIGKAYLAAPAPFLISPFLPQAGPLLTAQNSLVVLATPASAPPRTCADTVSNTTTASTNVSVQELAAESAGESENGGYPVFSGDEPLPPLHSEILRRVARCVGMCPLELQALVHKQEKFLLGEKKKWISDGRSKTMPLTF